jgi:hypothetical protein
MSIKGNVFALGILGDVLIDLFPMPPIDSKGRFDILSPECRMRFVDHRDIAGVCIVGEYDRPHRNPRAFDRWFTVEDMGITDNRSPLRLYAGHIFLHMHHVKDSASGLP